MNIADYDFYILYELDSNCALLYDVFTNKIFKDSISVYQKKKNYLPQYIYDAGFTPESCLTASEFGNIVSKYISESSTFTKEEIYKYIYERDVHVLISCLQGRLNELKEHFIIYSKEFKNLAPFETQYFMNTVFYQSGGVTALIFSQINSIIIKAASILDLISKIHCEYHSKLPGFSKIEKLRSSKVIYQGYNQLNVNIVQKKVFNMIFSLRNELIHNGSIDNNYIYFETKNNLVVNKWIPLQDFSKVGYLNASNNRKSFFSQENKFNKMAPIGIDILLKWLLKTIKYLT